MSAVPKVEEVVAGVYLVPLGPVNVFLLRGEEEWVLIDAGLPGSAAKILAAAESLGIRGKEISTLILTHAHPDHIGAAAAIQKATGAQVMVHALDAGIARAGTGFRSMKTAPGLMNRLVVRPLIRLMASRMKQVEPVRVDREIKDGDLLPVVDGGLEVIHVPGHCAGQVALRWERHGGVLFAADACVNPSKEMGWAPSYEDLEEGRRSLRKLAGLEFEVACFGHGAPIVGGAKAGFVRKWR